MESHRLRDPPNGLRDPLITARQTTGRWHTSPNAALVALRCVGSSKENPPTGLIELPLVYLAVKRGSLRPFGGIESRQVSMGRGAVSGCVTNPQKPQSARAVRETRGGWVIGDFASSPPGGGMRETVDRRSRDACRRSRDACRRLLRPNTTPPWDGVAVPTSSTSLWPAWSNTHRPL